MREFEKRALVLIGRSGNLNDLVLPGIPMRPVDVDDARQAK